MKKTWVYLAFSIRECLMFHGIDTNIRNNGKNNSAALQTYLQNLHRAKMNNIKNLLSSQKEF